MEKLEYKRRDLAAENFARLSELFPEAVTETMDAEGRLVRAIDADVLRQAIAAEVVEGPKERYQFTWPDKKKSVVLANAPSTKAFRLEREKSVGRDGKPGSIDTENLYIEGDNLDALKLLQETYLGKVKMIYIDPPYNTGSDAFVYDDDYSTTKEEFAEASGARDEEGNRVLDMRVNNESNGRFHTDWLNMMYPRLRLAKDLLAKDGVIFISIDDNEQANLKKVCDEIFGGQNFIAQFVWERAFSPKNDAKFISNSHDYVFMYACDISIFQIGRLPRTKEANARYHNPDNDPRGVWMSSDISVKTYTAENDYPITAPSGRVIEPPAGRCWSLSKNKFLERLQDNRIWFGPDGNGVPRIKRFLSELKYDGMTPTSLLSYKEVGHSQEGAKEVTQLFDAGVFDGPKPVRLLMRLLTLANLKKDSIVLDFFSGSATTAHALMLKNVEDNGNRKFILVQVPDGTDATGTAYRAGYNTICDIGEERIRRAGAKILSEQKSAGGGTLPDVGFRVLRIDSANKQDVTRRPQEFRQEELLGLADNIKADRMPDDLLLETMLELGIPLSESIETVSIGGKPVYSVSEGYLLACFEEDVTEEVVTAIAKLGPQFAVFRDGSIASDSVLTNFEQIFATYSPQTVRKVI